MKKVYFLSTCSTCQRIMNDLKLDGFVQQDIKHEKITPEQLNEMKERAGSFEALFSRRAMKYKSMGLANKNLGEKDYQQLILDEYTFLKRPVFVVDDEIFIGNAAATIEKLKKRLV